MAGLAYYNRGIAAAPTARLRDRHESFSARGNVILIRHQGKVLALLLFWLASGIPNLAQQPADSQQPVTGAVRTAEGTPVPAATVRLINTETNKTWLSWTDESGKFDFPQIPAGSYSLEASQLGFANASLVMQVPVVPPGPIPIVLRVATLAELAAKPEATRPPRSPRAPSGTSNPNNANAAGPGRQHGGRGSQVPAGISNAISAGLAGGGFEQTDLTDEGAGGPTGATNAPANESTQIAAELPSGAGTSATSDSFLLQGTVGQGLAGNGPGGFGQNGLIPGNPAGEGGPGGQGPGGGRGGPRRRRRRWLWWARGWWRSFWRSTWRWRDVRRRWRRRAWKAKSPGRESHSLQCLQSLRKFRMGRQTLFDYRQSGSKAEPLR